ncbi:MAG TPA: hypothetical protein VJJ48_02045 [Candidatus Paceibacterota bacterium]
MQKVKVISIEESSRRYIFLALVGIMAFSAMTYVYGINSIAKNTALRAGLEEQVGEAGNELSKLEFQYISLKSKVTLQLAEQYGFKEAKNPIYVSRSAGTALTWNR